MVRLVILRLLESYFRHRWLYLLPVVLMAVIAVFVFVNATPSYISSSILYVQKESLLASLTSVREDGFSWVTPADATVDEFNELLATDAFIRAVVQQTDLEAEMETQEDVGDTIDEVRDAVWIQTLGKNNLVMVGAAHEQAVVAPQIVEATINSYIQWKINNDREESVAAQTFFVELIEGHQAALELAREEMRTYLVGHPEPIRGQRPQTEQLDISRLQNAIDLADQRLATALEKEENARLASAQAESDARQTYFVIDAATLPDKPAASKMDALITSLVFVVVGVGLMVVGVIGAALIDRTFRFSIDVRHGIELPVLALVPNAEPKKKGWFSRGKKNEDASTSS